MKEATKRWIFRWVHIICGIPILGFIYDRLRIRTTTPSVRYVFLPVLLLFGALDVKGMSFDDLFSRRSARQEAPANPTTSVRQRFAE